MLQNNFPPRTGSHKWHDQEVRQPPDVGTVQMEMGVGSLLAWTGAMWHGGGANKTKDQSRLAVDINFNLSYLRQQENQYIGVPREEVAKMPERLQRVLGYQQGMSIAGPGMVDLRDPLKMMDRVHFGYDVNGPDMPAIG
ncbi:MAG: phytanoyl-CoA dioxygenase family protein [Gammaproteobacteria bacterium]|nr:phytanoyl-CoA dioxygenase family protein [Gammaproteobacteria bacterium]